MEILFALLGAGSAGSFLAIGAAANARLMRTLHSPIAAAAINFIVGFSVLSVLLGMGILKSSSNLEMLVSVPWWAFLGGFLGATFVTLNTLTIPKLGLTTTAIAVVLSQMTMSLAIDHLGWFGVIQRSVSASKLFGIGLLFVAVALTQLDSNRSNSPQR